MEANQQSGQTVAIQAYSSPKAQSEATQKQLRQILSRMDQSGPVAEARQAMDTAKQRIVTLRQAQVRLMQASNAITRELRDASVQGQSLLIDGAAEAEIQEAAARIATLEARYRLLLGASERLAEQSLPLAEIDDLRRTSDHMLAQARALRQESALRIAKTAKLMAEAAQFEGNISFDTTETLSGALVAHAADLEAEADRYRRWAAERADKHQQTLRALDSLKALS